jgi:hypothetical protein
VSRFGELERTGIDDIDRSRYTDLEEFLSGYAMSAPEARDAVERVCRRHGHGDLGACRDAAGGCSCWF